MIDGRVGRVQPDPRRSGLRCSRPVQRLLRAYLQFVVTWGDVQPWFTLEVQPDPLREPAVRGGESHSPGAGEPFTHRVNGECMAA